MAKEKMKVQSQTNPNKGMGIFLNPTPSSSPQVKTNDPQPKINQSNENKLSQTQKDQKPNNSTNPQPKINEEQPKPIQTNRNNEIEENIRKIEEQLMKSKTLDLTTFNNIVFVKKLSFKLLFIKSKIYVIVRDANGRSAIVSIKPPRFGGSSLRYLITQCNDWCVTIKKKTAKGEILSYQPLNNTNNEELDNDDIFD